MVDTPPPPPTDMLVWDTAAPMVMVVSTEQDMEVTDTSVKYFQLR